MTDKKKIWKKIVSVLACVAVFITTYSLILPAITLSNNTSCGLQEHAHNESCYTLNLVCDKEESNPMYHVHGESCYENEELICGKDENAIEVEGHTHTSECYETVLTCSKEEHTHISSCFKDTSISKVEETKEPEKVVEETKVASTTKVEEKEIENKDSIVEADVNGIVVTHIGQSKKTSAMSAMTLAETEPLEVDNYVIDHNDKGTTQLLYKEKGGTEWLPITSDTKIPGDASLHLDVVYANVPLDALIAAGGQLSYTLPEYMKDIVTSGTINAGNATVGSITVTGNTVIITFNEDFLQEQKEINRTLLDGTFFVEAAVDVKKVEETKPEHLVIGDVTIDLDFEDNLNARTADVKIEKKKIENLTYDKETNQWTVGYSVKVTANEEGAPSVKVVDTIKADGKGVTYVKGYVGISEKENTLSDTGSPRETITPSSEHGSAYLGSAINNDDGTVTIDKDSNKQDSLIWDIGDMSPNEERTLYYKIIIDEQYLGIRKLGAINNEAKVISDKYVRDSKTNSYTQNASVDRKKENANIRAQEDGSFLIDYTVKVTAKDTNLWTLTNVRIEDSIGFSDPYKTELHSITRYVSYEDDTFELVDSNGNTINTNQEVINKNKNGFTYEIGDLAPGESKTLTYTMRVSPEAFVDITNKDLDNFVFRNTATIRDDKNKYNTGSFGNTVCTTTLNRKQWARKLAGDKVSEDTSILMKGETYDASTTDVSKIENPGSFVVPKGSYEYTVIANEAGDWNLSSSIMKDQYSNTGLGNEEEVGDQFHMEFVGYIKVNAYDVNDVPSFGDNNKAAKEYFDSKTPVKTVWVKVDEARSFQFSPKDIGLDGNYAYTLSYYAKPIVDENDHTVYIASNIFSVSGTVGVGDKEYILTGVEAEGDVIISKTGDYRYEKHGWYFDDSKDTSYEKGTLYWIIKLDGTELTEDLSFIEFGAILNEDEDTMGCLLHRDFIVGTYKGDTDSEKITSCKDYQEAISNGLLVPCQEAQMVEIKTSEIEDNEEFSEASPARYMHLNNTVTLGANESLYVVVKTEPQESLNKYNEVKKYGNSFIPMENFMDLESHATATLEVPANHGVSKIAGAICTLKASKKTRIQKGPYTSESDMLTTYMKKGNGTYVDWTIHLNSLGNLEGKTVDVEDVIPEGMELAYVRAYAVVNGDTITTPRNQQLVDDGYVECDVNAAIKKGESMTSLHSDSTKIHTYSYIKDNKVRWIAADIKGEVVYQIVCKVTDQDTLLSEQAKVFDNTVIISSEDGEELDRDTSSISLSKKTLSKVGTYNSQTDGGRYPFKITINELGEDLVNGSDTITLIDELSDSLKLDSSSILIINSDSKQELDSDKYKVSVEGQTLKVVLPDNIPITITYSAFVQAAPGQEIRLENVAHWEGYEPSTSTQIEEKTFSYKAGGTVSTSDTPYVEIKKVDGNDISIKLAGASFTVSEVNYVGGKFIDKDNAKTWSGTTNDNGILKLGLTGNLMSFNTVYKIVETNAPEGYVVDSTPHYFVVAEESNGKYPDILTEYANAGAKVYYLDAKYEYTAYNYKGSLQITKQFSNEKDNISSVSGTYYFGVYEVNEDNSIKDKVQETSITFTKEQPLTSQSVEVKNLDVGKKYAVYELDGPNGNKIENGTVATMNGIEFKVTCDNNVVTITSDKPNVTITNTAQYSLPLTGGMGTTIFRVGGLAMMLMSLCIMIGFKRKIRKEGN